MNTRFTGILIAAIAGAMTIGTALAKPHDEPGTPGEPNCKGQTMAHLAQGAGGGLVGNGIGNVAGEIGITVQDLHALVDEYCAG